MQLKSCGGCLGVCLSVLSIDTNSQTSGADKLFLRLFIAPALSRRGHAPASALSRRGHAPAPAVIAGLINPAAERIDQHSGLTTDAPAFAAPEDEDAAVEVSFS